jgi:hypothetical protein
LLTQLGDGFCGGRREHIASRSITAIAHIDPNRRGRSRSSVRRAAALIPRHWSRMALICLFPALRPSVLPRETRKTGPASIAIAKRHRGYGERPVFAGGLREKRLADKERLPFAAGVEETGPGKNARRKMAAAKGPFEGRVRLMMQAMTPKLIQQIAARPVLRSIEPTSLHCRQERFDETQKPPHAAQKRPPISGRARSVAKRPVRLPAPLASRSRLPACRYQTEEGRLVRRATATAKAPVGRLGWQTPCR